MTSATSPLARKSPSVAVQGSLAFAGAPDAITPSELESHLWAAANILRGSPVDRTDWKSYILPLPSLKRICEVWDEEEERRRMMEEGGWVS